MLFGTLSPMWQNVRMIRLDSHSRGAACEVTNAHTGHACGAPSVVLLAWIGEIPQSRRECRHHARESLRRIAAAKCEAPSDMRRGGVGMRYCTSCGRVSVLHQCCGAETWTLSPADSKRWIVLGTAAFHMDIQSRAPWT